jgi:hypothetical protein
MAPMREDATNDLHETIKSEWLIKCSVDRQITPNSQNPALQIRTLLTGDAHLEIKPSDGDSAPTLLSRLGHILFVSSNNCRLPLLELPKILQHRIAPSFRRSHNFRGSLKRREVENSEGFLATRFLTSDGHAGLL